MIDFGVRINGLLKDSPTRDDKVFLRCAYISHLKELAFWQRTDYLEKPVIKYKHILYHAIKAYRQNDVDKARKWLYVASIKGYEIVEIDRFFRSHRLD